MCLSLKNYGENTQIFLLYVLKIYREQLNNYSSKYIFIILWLFHDWRLYYYFAGYFTFNFSYVVISYTCNLFLNISMTRDDILRTHSSKLFRATKVMALMPQNGVKWFSGCRLYATIYISDESSSRRFIHFFAQDNIYVCIVYNSVDRVSVNLFSTDI